MPDDPSHGMQATRSSREGVRHSRDEAPSWKRHRDETSKRVAEFQSIIDERLGAKISITHPVEMLRLGLFDLMAQLSERLDAVEAEQSRSRSMNYRGVFSEGETYEPGDFVTSGGSMWSCKQQTTAKPGARNNGTEWTLAVKRGRDGRRNDDEKANPPGPSDQGFPKHGWGADGT
jgi:hypothetical protein